MEPKKDQEHVKRSIKKVRFGDIVFVQTKAPSPIFYKAIYAGYGPKAIWLRAAEDLCAGTATINVSVPWAEVREWFKMIEQPKPPQPKD